MHGRDAIKFTILTTLLALSLARPSAAAVVTLNEPATFSTPDGYSLTVRNLKLASKDKGRVMDCVKKLKDFGKNPNTFYKVWIEYSDKELVRGSPKLERCTLGVR